MMRILSVFITGLLILLLGGCASKGLQPMELVDFEPKATISKQWSANVGSGLDIRYTLLAPVIVGENIYTVDHKGTVSALDKNTGKQIWRVKLKEEVSGGLGYGNGTLFLGTYEAQIIALNITDGSEKWRATVSSEVLSNPQTNGSVVVAQVFDGSLVGLDHDTGKALWKVETDPPTLTLRGNSSPLIVGANVYSGFATGKVLAVGVNDGLLVWEQRVAIPQGRSELERMVDIDGSPLRVGEIIFIASYQGQLMALSRATGRPLWSKAASTYLSLASGQDNIYLTDSNGGVKAFRSGSGQLSWENEQLLRRKTSAPHTIGNYVVVADEEGGYLHVLSQTSGEFMARKKIDGSGVRSPMVSADGVLYVYSNDGKLTALKIEAIASDE
ncbi:outer membrane protein assembly factor BamB [Aurantivibrio infirmus]